MAFEYVQQYYDVPACYGRMINFEGKSGIITKDLGHHIGVNFDEDEPGVVFPLHPTYKVEYLGIGAVRMLPKKKQRAKEKYQMYLELNDCFDSFIDFCRWYDRKDREERRYS